MKDNYVTELTQVAAVAMAAIQHYETGSTKLLSASSGTDFEYGRISANVLAERHRQEEKWGERGFGDMSPRDWLTVLVEELGEVGREILERHL